MKRRLPLPADNFSHSLGHSTAASLERTHSPSKLQHIKVVQSDHCVFNSCQQGAKQLTRAPTTQPSSFLKQQQHPGQLQQQPSFDMHLATASPISTRAVTRSKSKADGAAEARREALAAGDAAHQHNPPALAGVTDLHALKPAALSTQQVPGHHATLFPSTASKRAATAIVAAPTAPAGCLHAALSDDLQQLLDQQGHQQLIAAATAVAARLPHPSLLRLAGASNASKHSAAQATATAAVGSNALPLLRKQVACSPASHSSGRGELSGISSVGSSRHASNSGRASTAAAGCATSSRRSTVGGSRRVSFAPGPLHSTAAVRSPVTDDGHPATEGALAVPVRRVSSSYALDLTRGNVLMLEQLLGPESALSVARLKRRVGLLPAIRPPRPHACSRPAGSDGSEEEEEEEEAACVSTAAGSTTAAAAAGAGACAGTKVPGRARCMPVAGSRAAGTSVAL